jgi:hypothetical protein
VLEAGELARYRLLITSKLLILHTAVNAKSAVFASPIHVEFTLHLKAGQSNTSDLLLPLDCANDGLSDRSDAFACSDGEAVG